MNVIIDEDHHLIYSETGVVDYDLYKRVKNMFVDDWHNLSMHPFPFEIHTHPQDPTEQFIQLKEPWQVRKLSNVVT